MLRSPLTAVLLLSALALKCVDSTTTGTHAAPFSSLKINGLLRIGQRQEETCEIPGGPICDSVSCCAPGQECCPGGCCEDTEVCFQQDGCCPVTSKICPGESACCDPEDTCCGDGCCSEGTECCGDGCCAFGEFCERGECFDIELQNSVVRFTLDIEKNQEILENMCEGMKRGNGGVKTNSEVLTYRGKEAGGEPRGPVRRAAGCVSGYCRNAANNGNNLSFNSCDEYPPASTLEGGDSREAAERIIVCLPGTQNSHQGWVISNMLQKFKAANGREMQAGEQFLISIDCDEVDPDVRKRSDTVSSSGSGGYEAVDSDLRTSNDSYIMVALGDVAAGSYIVNVQVATGSTTGGFVFDSEGDAIFASASSGLTAGQSQQYSFTFGDDMFGVAVALATTNNKTAVTWSLNGTTSTPTSSLTLLTPTGTNPPILSSATRIVSSWAALVTASVMSFAMFIVI